MVQETQVPTSEPPSIPELLATPAEVAEEPAAPAVEPEPQEGVTAEEGATEETPETWESVRERFLEDETFKAEYLPVSEVERIKREIKREGHIEGQKREAGQRKEIMEQLGQVHQGFSETAAILRKAVNDGYLDGDFVVRALQQYAPSWAALQGYNERVSQAITREGQRGGALVAIAQIANHPLVKDEKLGQQFVDKFFYDYGIDPQAATETFKEFMDEVFDRVAERAKKPAQRELSKAEAAIEKGKLAARQNGPDTAPKGSGGGLTYKQLMDMPVEEYEKVPEATKRTLFQQEEARRRAG